MSRRKQPLQISDPIAGVTTRHGKIIRVQYGRSIVIDIEHGTTYNAYPKAVHQIDEQTIKETARAARKWLKPPPGSIPIIGHNTSDASRLDTFHRARGGCDYHNCPPKEYYDE